MSHFLAFREISKEQLNPNLVGGKASALARLYQEGFPVPDGFVATTEFFDRFSKDGDIEFSNHDTKTIFQYFDICNLGNLVAVRSSASVEDSSTHSFAGQFDSFLNVERDHVLEAIKKCWRSLYNTRAIKYASGQSDNQKMAVIVQKMIVPEVAGVAFSAHPVTGDKHSIVIEAVLGSNEFLVQGKVTPDYYVVSKDFTILDKNIVPVSEYNQQKLPDRQFLEVARLVTNINRLFDIEVDVEWAMENGKIHILQSRPITTIQHNYA